MGKRGCNQSAKNSKVRHCERREAEHITKSRREAIQCRSPQIRMLRPRHWIAAPVSVLRIATLVCDPSKVSLFRGGASAEAGGAATPSKPSSLIFDI
jgi:hypothetical protein